MDRFATVALALSTLAARRLGWRPGEFWDATPAELATCLGLDSGPDGHGPAGATGLDRATLCHMMEQDHDR